MEVLRENILEEIEKLKKEGKTIQGVRMMLHSGDCPLERRIFGESIEISPKEDFDANYICKCFCKMSKTSLLPYLEFEKPKTHIEKKHCTAQLFYVSQDTRKYIENLLKPILVYGGG